MCFEARESENLARRFLFTYKRVAGVQAHCFLKWMGLKERGFKRVCLLVSHRTCSSTGKHHPTLFPNPGQKKKTGTPVAHSQMGHPRYTRASEDKRKPNRTQFMLKKFSSSQFCARAEWLVRLVIIEPEGNWGARRARIGYRLLRGGSLCRSLVLACAILVTIK